MKNFMKKALFTGLATLALTPAFAVPTQNVTPAEKAKIETVVHDYLVNKPEVIVQAMQVLQQRQMEQAQNTIQDTKKTAAKFANALFHQPQDPAKGNPKAKISIVEFYDYQCPHCLAMAPVIAKALANNKDIRVIFKDFPIRGPLSEVAAKASIAAHKQGKYYELNHALLSMNKPLTKELIFKVAKEQGINVDKLKKDMNAKSVDMQLEQNTKLAQDLKLFGTPAFFIMNTDSDNNPIQYVPGQLSYDQLQNMINQAK